MIVHPSSLPTRGREVETMLVWMDEEAMDAGKSFYLKHTTNTTRCRIDHLKYKVDVNTMEHSKADGLVLNEIGRAIITTSKELFFDPYHAIKAGGAFVLIDPITNNTSAVGMIVCPASQEDLHTAAADLPTLDLPRLGIDPANYPAIETAVKDLARQGFEVKIIK